MIIVLEIVVALGLLLLARNIIVRVMTSLQESRRARERRLEQALVAAGRALASAHPQAARDVLYLHRDILPDHLIEGLEHHRDDLIVGGNP